MNSYAVPPVVAGFVSVVIGIVHRFDPTAPEPIDMSLGMDPFLSVVIQRFVPFILVYGLVFGLAFWVGVHSDDSDSDGTLALATGVVAALAYFGTRVAIWLFDTEQVKIISVLTLGGSSVGISVQLAVVSFAGVSLARRRS
jgi:hypothetical protein